MFWIRIIGSGRPADSPAAIEKASPSRLTGTSRSDGSPCMSWYRKFVSLSGSHTTWVTPFVHLPEHDLGAELGILHLGHGHETSTTLVGARIPGAPGYEPVGETRLER